MYDIHQLSAGTEAVQEVPPQNATANISSAGVDMQGWDGVKFDVDTGVIGTSAALNIYATESVNSNYSGEANIAGANINVATANAANAHLVLDLFRPDQRYVRLKLVPVTANGIFVSATSTRYRRTGTLPPTHGAFATTFVQVS